jgi:hypothetical protein
VRGFWTLEKSFQKNWLQQPGYFFDWWFLSTHYPDETAQDTADLQIDYFLCGFALHLAANSEQNPLVVLLSTAAQLSQVLLIILQNHPTC